MLWYHFAIFPILHGICTIVHGIQIQRTSVYIEPHISMHCRVNIILEPKKTYIDLTCAIHVPLNSANRTADDNTNALNNGLQTQYCCTDNDTYLVT